MELRIGGVYLHWLGNKFSVALESVSRGDVTENVITLYPNLLVLPLLVLYLVGVFVYLSFSFSENLSFNFFYTCRYVEGGMGSVSSAISKAALEAGVQIVTNAEVHFLFLCKPSLFHVDHVWLNK